MIFLIRVEIGGHSMKYEILEIFSKRACKEIININL